MLSNTLRQTRNLPTYTKGKNVVLLVDGKISGYENHMRNVVPIRLDKTKYKDFYSFLEVYDDEHDMYSLCDEAVAMFNISSFYVVKDGSIVFNEQRYPNLKTIKENIANDINEENPVIYEIPIELLELSNNYRYRQQLVSYATPTLVKVMDKAGVVWEHELRAGNYVKDFSSQSTLVDRSYYPSIVALLKDYLGENFHRPIMLAIVNKIAFLAKASNVFVTDKNTFMFNGNEFKSINQLYEFVDEKRQISLDYLLEYCEHFDFDSDMCAVDLDGVAYVANTSSRLILKNEYNSLKYAALGYITDDGVSWVEIDQTRYNNQETDGGVIQILDFIFKSGIRTVYMHTEFGDGETVTKPYPIAICNGDYAYTYKGGKPEHDGIIANIVRNGQEVIKEKVQGTLSGNRE